MKKLFKLPLVLLSISLLLTGCNNNNNASSTSTTDTNTTSSPTSTINRFDYGDYYSSIDSSLSGSSLQSSLNKLNQEKFNRKHYSYKTLRIFYRYCEQDYLDTAPKGKMYGFYDNSLVSETWDNQATWNHEHVWPNSRGGNKVEDDLHMVRPTAVSKNSERGNKAYAESGAYDPGKYFKEYRGIAARIIFYCAIRDTSLKIVDSTSNSSSAMGKLSDLLKWNLQYLPSVDENASLALRIEQNRNQKIYEHPQGQGNRNPFIDHPEYACKIWGSTNSETKKICGI